uniref:hypothetical protein n=1 Tax=Flavobacterium sp. TaxID=239 RepID=UPI00404B6E9B
MKNLFLKSISIFGLALLVFSCGKQDSSDAFTIVGKWEYVEKGVFVDGKEVMEKYGHSSGCAKNSIEFKTNNKLVTRSYVNSAVQDCEEIVSTVSYSYDGSEITFNSEFKPYVSELIKLTATELKFKDAKNIYTFKKVFN